MKKSILEIQVSLFANYTSAEPGDTISLLDWLLSDGYKNEVLAIRACKSEVKKKLLKQRLPATTPSGEFEGNRKADKLIKHSGLICLDIDGKDNPHLTCWEETKSILSTYSNVAYCGLSVSGNGVFVIVPIAYPTQHLQHFCALQLFFLSALGITVDKACKDVGRLRGISYDSTPLINHSAEKFTATFIPKTDFKSANFPANARTEAITLRRILAAVERQKTDITPTYEEWRNVGFALANTFGDEGRCYYHQISQLNTKYNKQVCDRQYTNCLKGRNDSREFKIGFGTLVHIARQYLHTI